MPRVLYTKPALTFDDQLQQLKDRGLTIENDPKALHLLENISYYRLSGYWYPFLSNPKSDHLFKPHSSFNSAFNLYCFDRELRKLVSSELEKIEVAIRDKMIYILSHTYGPFWYHDSSLFINQDKFIYTGAKITEEYNRSREDFILSFKKTYSNPLPPSWMIFEIASFGTLSNIYENLKPTRSKRDIAQYFGLDDRTFTSWMHGIVYIRNVCAHHSRLWNKKLSIAPVLPVTPVNQWLNVTTNTNTVTGAISLINNRTYYILSMILYLLHSVNSNNKFKDKFYHLLSKYPNVDPAAMGFTRAWRNEPLWHLPAVTTL